MSSPARLLAIVAVLPQKRVQCMQPGCGHGVYAAIHVVEENGQILVLGSTCFAKRFGSASALGLPAYSAGGGNGKPLTEDERQLLMNNTAELMARFKAEHDATMAAAEARLRELRERAPSFNIVRRPAPPPPPPPPEHPWPWQHRQNSSVALLRGSDGQCWVRVMHQNGKQMLSPWPMFRGWETALPAICGAPDLALKAYVVPNIVTAIQALRQLGYAAPEVTRWPEILKIAPRLPRPTAR